MQEKFKKQDYKKELQNITYTYSKHKLRKREIEEKNWEKLILHRVKNGNFIRNKIRKIFKFAIQIQRDYLKKYNISPSFSRLDLLC